MVISDWSLMEGGLENFWSFSHRGEMWDLENFQGSDRRGRWGLGKNVGGSFVRRGMGKKIWFDLIK
jgi:hypothetical protein